MLTVTTPLHGTGIGTSCAKPSCGNDRGRTRDGVTSVFCQYHTDAWQLRLDSLQAAHPLTPRVAAELERDSRRPLFRPPPPVLSDAAPCTRCHQAERAWPDHLCEECRRG